MFGRMISFATWEKFINASSGTAAMKRRLIDDIREHVREGNLLDSFKLGLRLGALSRDLSPDQLTDFELTILLTRDLNNVPFVQINGQPVS